MAEMGKLERFFYSKRGEMLMGMAGGIFAALTIFIDSRQSVGMQVLLILFSAIVGSGFGYLIWRFKIAIFGNKLEKTIWVHGNAYGRTYEYECDLVSRTDEEAIFVSRNEGHEIKLTPRYADSKLGSTDIPADAEHRAATVCAFYWDGEYAAFALLEEQGNAIDIWVHEH